MYKKTNREKSKTAKRTKFWCRCDRNLVGQTGKCGYCGKKSEKKKLKNY